MAKLTKPKTLEAYKKARTALDNIARSKRANDAQKKKAKLARRKLVLGFIQKQEDEIAARTKQLQTFIADMEKLIKSIGKDSPIAALKTLTAVVGKSKTLLETPESDEESADRQQ